MFRAPCGSGWGVGGCGWVFGGWGWVGDGWMGVGGGCPPHTCMCMQVHAHMVNMIISCKWPPQLGESMGIPYDVIRTCTCVHACVCACMCVCMHVCVHMCGGHPLTTPHPHPPTFPTPQGGTPESVKIQ